MSNLDYKHAYRRNLPHIQRPGATLFVTFRLAGSLPEALLEQWKLEKAWLARLALRHPERFESLNPRFERRWFSKFENLLDSGSHGPLWLREPSIAKIVADSLHHRDGRVFRLDCFSIMPNHTHAVFKPLRVHYKSEALRLSTQDLGVDTACHSLASIMHSLKGYTAFKANRVLNREGEFWAHESYDHSVRNFEEWNRIIGYVLNNPVKAGFVKHWSDWPWNYLRKK